MHGYDVEKLLRKLAPYELAYEGEELGFVWGDTNRKTKIIGVTWRPTVSVLEECSKKKVDLLVIHEPLLQAKKATVISPSRLKYRPNQIREALLQKSGLAVLRAHSNWDEAESGNNDTLAQVLGIDVQSRIPYGRVGRVPPRPLSEYVNDVKKKLECKHVLVVGHAHKMIQGVAIVSGSGNALTEMIEVAKQEGADVLVSGDIQDSRARFATESDIALIDAGGYYTETPGMKNLAKLLSDELKGIVVEYLDPGPPWHFA